MEDIQGQRGEALFYCVHIASDWVQNIGAVENHLALPLCVRQCMSSACSLLQEELLAQFKATLKEADLLKAEWGTISFAICRGLLTGASSVLPQGLNIIDHADFWDVYMLRRFLRARQHDIPRAKEFWAQHIKWRQEFGVDEMDKFHFHERDAFISLYPQGYHKTDKMVCSTLS